MVDVSGTFLICQNDHLFCGTQVTEFFACVVNGALFHYLPLNFWLNNLPCFVFVQAVVPNIGG